MNALKHNHKPHGDPCLELPMMPASRAFPVIAMAASVGGLKALSLILGGLPADFPAAIAIVMHVAPDHKSLLAEILKCRTNLQVTEAHTRLVCRNDWIDQPRSASLPQTKYRKTAG
jgi:chemotaxis response regulator CheB